MKTIKDLNAKHWYRALKVLYVLIIIAVVSIAYSLYYPQYDNFFSAVIEPLIWALLILEVFKRAIYYVYSGTILPKKTETNEYILKIKNILHDLQKGTYDLPEETKVFLDEVKRVAQNEIDNFEKKDSKKDHARILNVYNLITEANNIYRLNVSGFSNLNETKVMLLYYAKELGMNVDSIKINI